MVWRIRLSTNYPVDIPGFADDDYLASYDPNGNDGLGAFGFTPFAHQALVFASAAAAIELYNKQSDILPIRPDGRPNKPLTAFNLILEEEG